MKYVKKPIPIEAVQLTEDLDMATAPAWFEDAVSNGTIVLYCSVENKTVKAIVNTLEGYMVAYLGSYIICGVNGELYPCRQDVFEKTYEACDDE